MSFCILLTFNMAAIILGIISLAPVCIYPFAKRFTWWPQIFLGLAFNWGALLAWTAHSGRLEWPAVVLYVAGIAWTLFYDTVYAQQDAEDDALIGVKSTARLFADRTPVWLQRFLIGAVSLMAIAVIGAAVGGSALAVLVALIGPWAFGWHLFWQLRQFDMQDDPTLLRLFRSNRDAGLLPLPFSPQPCSSDCTRGRWRINRPGGKQRRALGSCAFPPSSPFLVPSFWPSSCAFSRRDSRCK